MAESTIRLYWTPTDTYSVTAITWDGTRYVYQISNVDCTGDFLASGSMTVGSSAVGLGVHNGARTVYSSTYTSPHTYVTTTETINYAIASVTWNGSKDVFTIAGGDYTTSFLAGVTFAVTGTASNDGNKTVQSSSFSGGDTLIVATSTVNSPEGAGGKIVFTEGAVASIAVPYHHLEWTWTKLTWVTNNPAKRVEDRNGLIHRIASPNSTALQRFFIKAQCAVFPEDLLKVASNGWTLRKMVYELCFLRDTEFIILDKEIAVDSSSTAYTSLIAGKGHLDNVENVWDSLGIIDGAKSSPALEFTITSDGTFTDITAPAGASYRSRP